MHVLRRWIALSRLCSAVRNVDFSARGTAALVMVLARVLTLREAYEASNWPTLLLLAAMIPVGLAFETTGAAGLLASQVAAVGGWAGGTVALSVLMIATMLLSNVINNAAAAVPMEPIAISTAASLE